MERATRGEVSLLPAASAVSLRARPVGLTQPLKDQCPVSSLTASFRETLSQNHSAELLRDPCLSELCEVTHASCFRMLSFRVMCHVATDN